MITSSFTNKKPLCIFTAVFICILFFADASLATNEKQPPTTISASNNYGAYGPYCGLSCLYVVIKMAHKDINFRELIIPEYMGSRKGSSLIELKKAAEDNGLYAEPVKKFNSRMLKSCTYPVILHVKSDVNTQQYDHYVLFLEARDGKAYIVDPPERPRLVPFYDLAPRWDGMGIIVSSEPIDFGTIFAPARKQFLMWSVIAVGFILVLRWAKMRWLKKAGELAWHKVFGLSMVQGGAFVVLALVFGMGYHFVNDEGFLAHADATSSIQQVNAGSFIPKVSKEKVGKLLGSDAVFIDARMARDYEAGHLEGSISIPVNAEDDHRVKAMAGIAKDAKIVIYCQSSGCPYAGIVTAKLKTDGFSNISIFKGGWNEWNTKDEGKG